jgi:hypothetical protein
MLLAIFGSTLLTYYCYLNKELICYNAFYYFSYIQILLYRMKMFYSVNTPKPLRKISDNKDKYVFDCMDDINIVELVELKDTIENNSELVVMKKRDYKMIVYNDALNKICFYQPISKIDVKYELSNISFISFKIIIQDTEYSIKLWSNEYNFYIVNNIINSQWVKYYFQKYLGKHFMDTDKYTIDIIDDKVQQITLTENESILIEKDSYKIIIK